MSNVDAIVAQVAAWDGVSQQPHRFGGVEFNLGKVEIGHVHRNGMVDIPFTRKLREQLVADNRVVPHHVLPDSGWITFYVRQDADVDRAIRLFRLSYLQKARRRLGLDVAAVNGELAALDFGGAVNALLTGADDAEQTA